jgi:hypothetical protein
LAQTDLLHLKRRLLGEQRDSRRDGALDKAAWLVQARNLPGTSGWDAKPVEERSRWWANRVGAAGSLLASAPGVFGALADYLPVQDAFGFATQAVALCAVARERGVDDRGELVRMLAEVLCDRKLGEQAPDPSEPPDGEANKNTSRPAWMRLAVGLWQIARISRSITAELEKRPSGWGGFRLMGKIPVVGAVGDYLFEFGGVRRAVAAGERWLAHNGTTRPNRGQLNAL